MARPSPDHGLVSARLRAARWAGSATELALVLTVALMAALWVTGAPVQSLLPIHPPA